MHEQFDRSPYTHAGLENVPIHSFLSDARYVTDEFTEKAWRIEFERDAACLSGAIRGEL